MLNNEIVWWSELRNVDSIKCLDYQDHSQSSEIILQKRFLSILFATSCEFYSESIKRHKRELRLPQKRILYVNILPEECIAVFSSFYTKTVFYTLNSEAPYASSLYVHHAVCAALDILEVKKINFPIFIHFPST